MDSDEHPANLRAKKQRWLTARKQVASRIFVGEVLRLVWKEVAQGGCGFKEAFKARLDVALGSLVCWLAALHIAGGLKLDEHCGPFQPRPFYDSMIA